MHQRRQEQLQLALATNSNPNQALGHAKHVTHRTQPTPSIVRVVRSQRTIPSQRKDKSPRISSHLATVSLILNKKIKRNSDYFQFSLLSKCIEINFWHIDSTRWQSEWPRRKIGARLGLSRLLQWWKSVAIGATAKWSNKRYEKVLWTKPIFIKFKCRWHCNSHIASSIIRYVLVTV